MSGIIIEESGMSFGEYEEDNVFYMEKSKQYTKSLMPDGIKICEFLLLRNRNLLFVEAKKSCPNYYEANSTEEKKQKYEEYVDDIAQKMKDSLALYANIILERYEQDDVPAKLLKKVLKDKNLVFVLVVKNAEKKWLEPFSDVFRKKLHNEMKIWHIQSFLVINEMMAREKKLIK